MTHDSSDGGPSDLENVRRVIEVICNPPRLRVLRAVFVDGPVAADGVAERIEEPIHKVRRHLNFLLAADFVEIAREEKRRGAVKRYYVKGQRSIWIGGEDDARLDDREKRKHTLGAIRLIFEEATRAASNPQIGMRGDRLVANYPGVVDGRGWRELSELHHQMLGRVGVVLEESRVRLEAGDEKPIGVISEQILLESPMSLREAQVKDPR